MCAALQKGYANDGREDKRHFTKKDIRVHHRDFRFYTIKSVLYMCAQTLIDLCANFSLEQLRDFVCALHIYRSNIQSTYKKSNGRLGCNVCGGWGGRGRGKSDLFKYVPSLSVRVCAKLLGYEKNGDQMCVLREVKEKKKKRELLDVIPKEWKCSSTLY